MRASDDFEEIVENVETINNLKEILDNFKRKDDEVPFDATELNIEFPDDKHRKYRQEDNIDLYVTIVDGWME